MYSFEIENLLRNSNYIIDAQTYLSICESPQIVRIVFNKDNNIFYIHTNDEYSFEFRLHELK